MAIQINKKLTVVVTILVSIAALYALSGFLILPWYAKKALPDYVAEELQRELIIEQIQFNPFNFKLNVSNIDLNENDHAAIASMAALYVDIDLNFSQLLDKTISIATIRLNDPHVELIKDKTGSLNIDRFIKSFPQDKDSKTEEAKLNFIFESTQIIQGSVLVADNSQETLIKSTVKDINLSFSSISTIQKDEGDYQVSLDLDKNTKININGTLTLFPLMSAGQFQVNDLSAESVNGWLSELSTIDILGFNAAIHGDYQVSSNDEGEVSFNVDKAGIQIQDISIIETESQLSASLKKLTLNSLSYANDSLSIGAGQLSLSGLSVQTQDQILFDITNLSLSEIAYNIDAAKLNLAAVDLVGLNARTKEQTLLDVSNLSLTDIKYDVEAAALSLAVADLNNLDLLLRKDAAPFYHLGKIKVNTITFDNKVKQLAIEKIELSENNIVLDTDAAGRFIAPEFNIESKPEAEDESANEEVPSELKIALGELHIMGTSLGLIDIINKGVPDTLLTLNEVELMSNEFDLSQDIFKMGTVALTDAKLGLAINKDGVLNIQQLFSADKSAEAITQAEEKGTAEFSLGQLKTSGIDIQLIDNSNTVEMHHDLSSIGLEMLNLSNAEKSRSELNLNAVVNKSGQITLAGWVEPDTAKVNLSLALNNIELPYLSPYVERDTNIAVKSGELSFKGTVSNSELDTGLFIEQAEAELDNFLLHDQRNETRLIAFDKLRIADFSVKTSPLGIEVDKLKLTHPYINVHIDEQQNLNLVGAFSNKEQVSDTPESGEVNANSNPSFALKSIELEQGNMDFADLSMTPKFSVAIDELHGLATGLNSAPERYTSLDLNGRVNEFGSIAITGELQPFDYRKQSQVNMQFRNISTNSLSPYAAKFAGRQIKSGSLSLTLDYKLANNKLNGSNNIILESLVLGEKVASPDAMDLPLDMAISLLQDGDGKIDIKLPIKGDLDNPKFEIKSVVQKAIGNLIGGIVTAPFSFIGALFDIDGDELKLIKYEPGKSEIMPPEAEKLSALSKALIERPALLLVATGTYDIKRDSFALAKKIVLEDLSKITENEEVTLNYSEPNVRDAIDDLVNQRLDKETIGKLKENVAVDNNADETLIIVEYYKRLFSQLVEQESSNIDASMLNTLATERINSISDYIKGIDITLADRIQFAEESKAVNSEAALVSVTLEIDTVR